MSLFCSGKLSYVSLVSGVIAAVLAVVEAASASEVIRSEDGLVGVEFYLGDQELSRADLKQILSSSEACERRVRRAGLYEQVSGVSGVVGGGILLYGIGYSLHQSELKPVPVAFGVASLALNLLCFKYFDGKNFRVAVDIFNRTGGGPEAARERNYGVAYSMPFR